MPCALLEICEHQGHPFVTWKNSNIDRLSIIVQYFKTNVFLLYLCFKIYFFFVSPNKQLVKPSQMSDLSEVHAGCTLCSQRGLFFRKLYYFSSSKVRLCSSMTTLGPIYFQFHAVFGKMAKIIDLHLTFEIGICGQWLHIDMTLHRVQLTPWDMNCELFLLLVPILKLDDQQMMSFTFTAIKRKAERISQMKEGGEATYISFEWN